MGAGTALDSWFSGCRSGPIPPHATVAGLPATATRRGSPPHACRRLLEKLRTRSSLEPHHRRAVSVVPAIRGSARSKPMTSRERVPPPARRGRQRSPVPRPRSGSALTRTLPGESSVSKMSRVLGLAASASGAGVTTRSGSALRRRPAVDMRAKHDPDRPAVPFGYTVQTCGGSIYSSKC